MNLRDIKKDIEYVLGAFIEDCSVVAAVNEKVPEEKIAGLMEEAVELYNSLRDKVNAKPEGSAKAHFTSLRKEILEKTDALYTRLSEAVSAPAEEKKPARKAAPRKKKEVAEAPAPAAE